MAAYTDDDDDAAERPARSCNVAAVVLMHGAVGIASSILGAITLMPITISGAVRSPSLLFEKICAHDVLSVHIFVYYGNIIIIVILYARAVLIERILSLGISSMPTTRHIYIERNLCY